MKKLKNFKDGAKFTKRTGGTVYTLNTLIKSNKRAVYTSDSSQKTFIRPWDEFGIPKN